MYLQQIKEACLKCIPFRGQTCELKSKMPVLKSTKNIFQVI